MEIMDGEWITMRCTKGTIDTSEDVIVRFISFSSDADLRSDLKTTPILLNLSFDSDIYMTSE